MLKKKWFVVLALGTAFIILSFGIYLSSVVIGAAAIDEKELVMNETSVLEDEDGELIAELQEENRDLVNIEELPDHVKEAFVAIEDVRFYQHQGIDPRAIGRALYRDIQAGAAVEGGSTLTQQLAKNAFLTNDKSLMRKTKEVLIAMGLERKFSKDEILGYYLNQIYFGHGAYGIQAASEMYFNKDASELTIDEAALLAGMPKAPTTYSPVDNPEGSKDRRDVVLSVMERHGFINAEEAVAAEGRTVPSELHRTENNPAYYTYIDMVLAEAENTYSISAEEVYRGGYTITVPMNNDMQQTSYDLFQDSSYFPESSEARSEASFFMMDSDTGGVTAVQGGREYVRQGLNRTTLKRQPGSAMKPLAVYGPALDTGDYQPYSMLVDEKIDYDGYEPSNNNDEYKGEVSMSEAVIESTNTSAVWLYDQIGESYSSSWMEKAGIHVEEEGLGVALGGMDEGTSTLEMARAYTSFSNNGMKVEPYFIEKIEDRSGETIAEREISEAEVTTPQNAWYMTRMLEQAVMEGTGAAGGDTSYALAGKTGTTSFEAVDDAARDAWFAGYTPEWTGALWMGYDQTTEENYLNGGSAYAVTLFKEIINRLPEEQTASQQEFEKPEGVQDLADPIDMGEVDDLDSSLSFKGSGLINVQLTWTPSEDDRVKYKLYEIDGDEETEIAEIQGEGSYTVEGVNVFSLKDYKVVPFNSQTNQEGDPSNITEVEVGSIWGSAS